MPSKVLIVDDDKTTREGLAEFLEEAGLRGVAVGTFEDATRILRTTPPDLLIADVRLGPFNGLQLVISTSQADSRPSSSPVLRIPFSRPMRAAAAPTTCSSRCRRRGYSTSWRRSSPPPVRASAFRGAGNESPSIGGLPISVDDAPARILDVSYGGLRFEIQRELEGALPNLAQHQAADGAVVGQGQAGVGEPDWQWDLDVWRRPLSGNARVVRPGRRDLTFGRPLLSPSLPTLARLNASPTTTSAD